MALPFRYIGGELPIQLAYALNTTSVANGLGQDSTSQATFSTTTDTSANGANDFVRFTPSQVAAAVPEPTTGTMMLLALGTVGFEMRRKRRKSAISQFA